MMGMWKKLLLAGTLIVFVVPGYTQTASTDNEGGRRSNRSSRNNSSGRGETTDDRERRRESRNRTRETNSRSTRRSSNEKPSAAASDGQAKDTKTVKGKPESGGKKSSGSGGGGRPAVDIAFEMQVDPETNIMYLEAVGDRPSLNVNVLEKKKFVTRLALFNPRSSEFSQIDASIKYDPQLIRPVGVDDSTVSSNLSAPARVLVDQHRGMLSLAADFATSRSDSFLTVAKIQWQALEPVASTPIVFLNTDEHPSGVFNDRGENILHQRSDGLVQSSRNAGLLDATVAIEPEGGTIELAEDSGNPFSAVALATNINSGTAEGGIQLYLRPRRNTVGIGENLLVDVLYRNPRRADMDTVKLKLRFDPEVLEVVDTDDGNWISRGINIFDGAYHDDLPFDHHRKNQAHNNLGLIVYDMGFGSRTPVPEEGVIATIQFRAKAPTPATAISFSTRGDGATDSDTSISFLGFNLIGVPGARQQAMTDASVSVRTN